MNTFYNADMDSKFLAEVKESQVSWLGFRVPFPYLLGVVFDVRAVGGSTGAGGLNLGKGIACVVEYP